MTKTSDCNFEKKISFDSAESFLSFVKTQESEVIIYYLDSSHSDEEKGWYMEIYDDYRE